MPAAGVIGQIYQVENTMLDYQSFMAGSTDGMLDEQGLVAFVYLGGAFNVKLDFKSALSKSLFEGSDDLEPSLVHSRQLWRDKISGATPVFLHSNGGKMPFYHFNRSMWYSDMQLKDVHPHTSMVVHIANGSDVQFRTICPQSV